MAGLLDIFNDPQQAGLLSAAAQMMAASGPSRTPTSLGQIMGGGLLAGMQGMQHAQDRQRDAKLYDIKSGLLQQQLDEAKRQAEVERGISAAARDSMYSPEYQSLMGGGGPTVANAAKIDGLKPAFDTNGFINRVMAVDPMKGLALRQSLAKETHFNKVDPKDYTAESIARFAQTNNFADLVPRVKLEEVRLGGKVGFRNPYETTIQGETALTQSPDSIASNFVTMRGQNMNDARARELNAITREGQQTQVINDPVRGPILVNKGTGIARNAVGVDGQPIQGEIPAKRENAARNLMPVIDQAEKLISGATGSYAGAGIDQAARFFGSATSGDKKIAQLKVLEGNIMMNQPRMEGPQSDKDVAMYRQMAGQIGDPTVPNEIKKEALGVIKHLHQKYAGVQAGGASGDWSNRGGNVVDFGSLK